MNMISKLRRKFTSGNSTPVERTTITAQEFDQLQAEWIKRTLPEHNDYRTHHNDWVTACKITKDSARDAVDVKYWQYQIDTLESLATQFAQPQSSLGEMKITKANSGDCDLNSFLCAGHAQVKDGVVFNIDEKLWRAEEFEACMLAMDDAGVPRFDENDIVYSLWGRACWMVKNLSGG